MRVTQQMLFDRYVNNMNTSLTTLMDLNLKSQTQKNVNRPSDDPAGMIRILGHRDVLRGLDQYSENIDTAKGWLGRSDTTMEQLSVLLTRAKTLSEQAATGTLSDDNREEISYEMRSIYEQMIGLANMQFEDKYIYAGQKTGEPPFKEILWMTSNDEGLAKNSDFKIDGYSARTVLVQFYDKSGASATGDQLSLNDPNVGVRYSIDGGDTFLDDGSISIGVGGEARITLPKSGASITFDDGTDQVRMNDPSDYNNSEGTWMWLRPSAQYMGDDEDKIEVNAFGPSAAGYSTEATGGFDRDVIIRIDSNGTLGDKIEYSYSLDNGMTYITGNEIPADGIASGAIISIPTGGVLTLASNTGGAGASLVSGTQFVIHPRNADVEVDISASETVRINDIGKDLFGGVYQDPDAVLAAGGQRVALASSNASVGLGGENGATMFFSSDASPTKNLFETMGNLIAFLETNNQQGIQQSLENLEEVHKHIMNEAASVGGREHRLDVASNIIQGLELNEKERLSNVEDADIGELMTALSQQQIVYEAVLRSSSMIMQMNLMKFI